QQQAPPDQVVAAFREAEGQHRSQRDDRAHRQVNPFATADDHQRLTRRDDSQERRQSDDVGRLVQVDEIRVDQPAREEQDHGENQRDQWWVEIALVAKQAPGAVAHVAGIHFFTTRRTNPNSPGPASAAMIISAFTSVCDHVGTSAKKITFRMTRRIITPITAPAIPPFPPLRRVPPSTTATIESSVMLSPMFACPDPVDSVSAVAASPAKNPAQTYVVRRTRRTGMPVGYAAWLLLPVAKRYCA